MKKLLPTLCVLCVLCGQSLLAQSADETHEIEVLQSTASLQEKDAACEKLRLAATAKSVPALAALLPDEQLSHSARLVLEGMSNLEAGRALADALDKTSGLTRIGIINSLGVHVEKSAVPQLAKLLAGSDAATVSAVADALGQIGGSDAIKALENAPAPARAMTINALLACANQLLESCDKSAALEIFKRLDDPKEKDFVRTAAFRGIIRASGDKSLALVVNAIQGTDRAKQTAALQLVRELDDPATTKTIFDLLPKIPPAIQMSLIDSLAQRGNASAAPAILPFVSSESSSVRLAAINALGIIGDATAAGPLAQAAASHDSATQKAARQALLQLNRGDVTAALLSILPGASAPEAAEIARAIGVRAEGEAVKPLCELVASSTNDAVVSAARDALISIAKQTHDHRGQDSFVLNIAAHMSVSGSVEVQNNFQEILNSILSEGSRRLTREALNSNDPLRKEAGARMLCKSRDPELLPDILALAKSGDETIRVLAIRGGVRLVTEENSLSRQQRVETLKSLLTAATRPEEKRLVIGGLAGFPCDETLALAKSMLNSSGVEAEAKKAVEQITSAMSARKLKDGFILDWQVSELFREAGKNYSALFNTVFPPENPGVKNVTWRDLPAGTDAAKPCLLDLLKALGDEHQCVAYVRARIHSDASRSVRLEIGSDDGVKVWLNGAQVYANNTARAVTPGSDKVDVKLNAGWNSLMLKITQNIMGWEFCVRLVNPDGSPVTNIGIGSE